MRRLVGGLLVVSVLVALVPPAGAATTAPVAGNGTVSAPLVGFDPLFAPWWLRHAGRVTDVTSTTTVLYLADGSTPETGRGFAMTRSHAVDGADWCGTPLAPLAIRRGPFRGAKAVQSGATTILRRTGVRADARQAVLVTRGMTTTEVQAIAEQARVVRGAVLGPRAVPNDVLLRGIAPVDATLTGGPGTDFLLVGGLASDRLVRVHAFAARGEAQDAVRFFRATSVPMACTPGRYTVTTLGRTTAATTSSTDGDAARVAAMLEPVGHTGFAENLGWARHPGVTQFARRCKGFAVTTIAGRNHGRLWGVGLPFRADGPVCIGARSGGTLATAGKEGARGLVVSLRRTETCGLLLVAGRAPPRTRRITVHSGRAREQEGHLRTFRPRDAALWAALVRAAPVTDPGVTVTATDARGKVLGRVRVRAGRARRCRAGRPVPTVPTVPTSTTTSTSATS